MKGERESRFPQSLSFPLKILQLHNFVPPLLFSVSSLLFLSQALLTSVCSATTRGGASGIP